MLSSITILGAAGMTGQHVVQALARRGVRARACVRRRDQFPVVESSADPVIAEFADPSSIRDALAGAETAYYIPPAFCPDEEAFAANIIAAAKSAGLKRLVYHSVLHAATPGMRHHARKANVELLVRESALNWTIVQPAMYMQTPLFFLNGDRTELNPGFSVDQPFTPIDLFDVGEAAAAILTQSVHDFATYELAGGETISFQDMANTLSAVLGRAITARPLDGDDLVRRLTTARHLSESAALDLKAMLSYYNRHGLRGNGNVLRMILGRATTPFDAMVQRTLRAP